MGQFATRWKKALSKELGVSRLDRVEHDNHVLVKREADLPDPSGGTTTLNSSTVYEFDGFVSLDNPLELNGICPLKGRSGGVDGILYQGSGALFRGSGYFLAKDLYFGAPNEDIFDISADQTTEILVESCSFSDEAFMGNMNSLGTIDGYRVPSFKGCNFADFDDGLTFDGSPDKIFFSESPFRGVDSSGVTILTLASTIDTYIVDITDCYIKGVQSDTKVIDVKSGGAPTEIFQYRGTTHDLTVTKSNILNGEVGVDTVGTKVESCFPLKDSSVGGTLGYDGSGEVTGSGTEPTQVTTPTVAGNLERMSKASDGVLQYDAKFDEQVKVDAHLSVNGANSTFSIYIAKNGTEIPVSRMRGLLSNNSDSETISTVTKVDMTKGDTVSIFIENDGGSTDLNVASYNLTV